MAPSIELDLLAAIAAGDDLSREVYADWLEQHGAAERAEFLRLGALLRTLAEHDARRPGVLGRFLALEPQLDAGWRQQVEPGTGAALAATVPRGPLPGCTPAPDAPPVLSLAERLTWLLQPRPPRAPPPPFELPAQLRYLEALPATLPAPSALRPRKR